MKKRLSSDKKWIPTASSISGFAPEVKWMNALKKKREKTVVVT